MVWKVWHSWTGMSSHEAVVGGQRLPSLCCFLYHSATWHELKIVQKKNPNSFCKGMEAAPEKYDIEFYIWHKMELTSCTQRLTSYLWSLLWLWAFRIRATVQTIHRSVTDKQVGILYAFSVLIKYYETHIRWNGRFQKIGAVWVAQLIKITGFHQS